MSFTVNFTVIIQFLSNFSSCRIKLSGTEKMTSLNYQLHNILFHVVIRRNCWAIIMTQKRDNILKI